MTEEERLQMLKTRLEKRQKQEIDQACVSPKRFMASAPETRRSVRRLHRHEPDVAALANYLSQGDVSSAADMMKRR